MEDPESEARSQNGRCLESQRLENSAKMAKRGAMRSERDFTGAVRNLNPKGQRKLSYC